MHDFVQVVVGSDHFASNHGQEGEDPEGWRICYVPYYYRMECYPDKALAQDHLSLMNVPQGIQVTVLCSKKPPTSGTKPKALYIEYPEYPDTTNYPEEEDSPTYYFLSETRSRPATAAIHPLTWTIPSYVLN